MCSTCREFGRVFDPRESLVVCSTRERVWSCVRPEREFGRVFDPRESLVVCSTRERVSSCVGPEKKFGRVRPEKEFQPGKEFGRVFDLIENLVLCLTSVFIVLKRIFRVFAHRSFYIHLLTFIQENAEGDIASLKKELSAIRQLHDAGSVDSALSLLRQHLARPSGIFDPHLKKGYAKEAIP